MSTALRFLFLTFLFFVVPPVLASANAGDSDFEEADIESDEAIANSDAAIEEKKELGRLNIEENKRAVTEKKAALSAKNRAAEVEKKAKVEVSRLSKEVAAKRATIKQFEKEKNAALKLEERERQKIAVSQKEFEVVRTQLEEAKRAKDEANSNLERAKDMYKEEQKRIKLARQDLEKTKKETQNLKRREASVLQKMNKPQNVSPSRPIGASSTKVSKIPSLNFLSQDCNIRGAPGGNAAIVKKVLKGQRVMVHGNQGAWVVVGTPEVAKGYMSKICF